MKTFPYIVYKFQNLFVITSCLLFLLFLHLNSPTEIFAQLMILIDYIALPTTYQPNTYQQTPSKRPPTDGTGDHPKDHQPLRIVRVRISIINVKRVTDNECKDVL